MARFRAPRSLQHDRLRAEHDLAGGATRGNALAVAASAVGYAGPSEHRFVTHRRRDDDIRLGPAAARAGRVAIGLRDPDVDGAAARAVRGDGNAVKIGRGLRHCRDLVRVVTVGSAPFGGLERRLAERSLVEEGPAEIAD